MVGFGGSSFFSCTTGAGAGAGSGFRKSAHAPAPRAANKTTTSAVNPIFCFLLKSLNHAIGWNFRVVRGGVEVAEDASGSVVVVCSSTGATTDSGGTKAGSGSSGAVRLSFAGGRGSRGRFGGLIPSIITVIVRIPAIVNKSLASKCGKHILYIVVYPCLGVYYIGNDFL